MIDRAAPSVVQVQGHGRPASGVVLRDGIIGTTTHALGREGDVRVRRHDGQAFDAELLGWDRATSLAILRVDRFEVAPVAVAGAGAGDAAA